MEFRAFVNAAGIAMGIDMHHTHWPVLAQRTEDGITDRMIATDAQRHHTSVDDGCEVGLDIGMA